MVANVQRLATNQLLHIENLCYDDRLKALDLPRVLYRRLTGDRIDAISSLTDYAMSIWKIISSAVVKQEQEATVKNLPNKPSALMLEKTSLVWGSQIHGTVCYCCGRSYEPKLLNWVSPVCLHPI
ncbi:hypothetical protein ElyMa_004950100 [Elysia marginata]|uniref:Uncharacterized protein n=1 Tax=Elysia marginata TaxID=1093978 RepID=A0AAV4J3W5_9GAST|nr:hypothetical protein ElyMa_004950100 [Elysia marginata]